MAITIRSAQTISNGIKLKGNYNINEGIILWLDAANPASYPGSGTTWYDLTSNHYNATLYGATYSNRAINFDYTQSQYAALAANNILGGDFTAIGWVYVRSYQAWSRLFDFGNGAGGVNVILAVTQGSSGNPVWSTDGADNINSSQLLPLNQWVQLSATQSGLTGTIYINGQQVASATNTGIATVTRNLNYIGKSNWNGDGYLDGKIKSLKMWNRTLSPSEISFDYQTNNPNIVTTGLYANYDATAITNTTTFPDSSGNGRNASLFNGPTTTIFNGTQVLQLNGSSQYFAKNDGYGSDLDSAFTFDVWACPVSAGTPGVLIAEWSPTVTGGWQDTQMGFTNVDIRAGVYNTNAAVAKDSWTANTWYHIVTTYDGSILRTYVNSVAGATSAGAKQSPTGSSVGPTVLSMGIPCADYLGGVSGYFHGFIGAWKIYNRALTPAEVNQNFNALRGQYGV
jgi:hypothetical protein